MVNATFCTLKQMELLYYIKKTGFQKLIQVHGLWIMALILSSQKMLQLLVLVHLKVMQTTFIWILKLETQEHISSLA